MIACLFSPTVNKKYMEKKLRNRKQLDRNEKRKAQTS